MKYKSFPSLLLTIALVGGLGCSVGRLIVSVPTPTTQPTKTPRPTFTFTPNWTPTLLSISTPTLTPVPPTDTPTVEATPEPETPTATSPPPPPTNTSVPQPPTNTPTPEPPTATPTPQYPFTITPHIHDTGSAIETRITAKVLRIRDVSKGEYDIMQGYQVLLVDPTGGEHLSNMSGGLNHSTGEGLGDNHLFNTEVKVAPYTSGSYRAWLVKDGVRQSSEIEFVMTAVPYKYVHLDFFWNP